jgi:ribonuclease T1
MSRRWTIGLLLLCCLLTVVSFGSRERGSTPHISELATAESQAASSAVEERRSPGPVGQLEGTAPHKAYELLTTLQTRDGAPLPGYVGGREFQNRERRLPPGRYREYDVNRKIPGRSRDAERIVIEQRSGRAYYSGDHYRTFVPLN